MRVPFLDPSFPPVEQVAADYAEIAASGAFSNLGPFERRFAASLAAWIGGGALVSVVSSGTSGLELAVQATFLPGRPLALVASFTFVAGPLVLLRAGYRPVFVDVSTATWQPDVSHAMAILERRHSEVGGLLLTATLGVADDAVSEWEELASRYDLPLVVDSAAGFGSRYSWDEPVGARGACEVFSLHATKTLAVGEGGLVSSRSPELVARIDRLKNFGFDDDRTATLLGTNAKLSEVSAAIGLRQLAALPGRLRAKQAIQRRYAELLEPMGFGFQPGAERSSVCFVSTLAPDTETRDLFRKALDAANIESRAYYNPPVHRHPSFASAAESPPLPGTEELSARVVSLPTSERLDPAVLDRVAHAAQEVSRG